MKRYLVSLICGLNLIVWHFSACSETTAAPHAEPIEFIRKAGVKSLDWYKNQAEAWRQLVESSPGDPSTWYNFYMASEYSYFGQTGLHDSRDSVLNEIYANMGERVGDSYEYHLLGFRRDPMAFHLLETAKDLRPDAPELSYDFIVHNVIRGDEIQFTYHNVELYNSADIVTGLVNYNYNVLMSLANRGILFTNGDNDTYPVWMLQEACEIRRDVTVINLPLATGYPEYLERQLAKKSVNISTEGLAKMSAGERLQHILMAIETQQPQLPVYVAMTVADAYTERVKPDLYIVGLAMRYASERFDNVQTTAENWEHNFRTDYLRHDWYSENHVSTPILEKRTNLNYIPLLMMLYEREFLAGNVWKSEEYKSLAFHIARKAKRVDELKTYLEQITQKKTGADDR